MLVERATNWTRQIWTTWRSSLQYLSGLQTLWNPWLFWRNFQGVCHLTSWKRTVIAIAIPSRLGVKRSSSNQCISYEVTPNHLDQIKGLIGDLALKLRSDQDWHPHEGEQCDRCGYRQYCSAQTPNPEPLPQTAKPPQKVQLALPFLWIVFFIPLQ